MNISNIDQNKFKKLIDLSKSFEEEFARLLPNKKFNKYTCEAKKR